jgi:hypothetical protein
VLVIIHKSKRKRTLEKVNDTSIEKKSLFRDQKAKMKLNDIVNAMSKAFKNP